MRYYPKYLIYDIDYHKVINNIGREGFSESYQDTKLNFTHEGEFYIETDYFEKPFGIHLYWISIVDVYELALDSDYSYFIIYPGEKEKELAEFLENKLTVEEYIIQSIIK